ncbi:unnamed protein product [Penicillium camemberti]|uniref:Str. FM013 n=1 Tax=Penicillium camemberti (strain FM 013) TaxID=1429867 RepID=A0A0G4P259_PENC3|nr:unnamed protein product [Penicillium camemberti]
MAMRAPSSDSPALVIDSVVGSKPSKSTGGSTRLPTLLIEIANDWWSPALRSLKISSLSARTNCKKKVKLHVGNINVDCNLSPPQWVNKCQIVQWV